MTGLIDTNGINLGTGLSWLTGGIGQAGLVVTTFNPATLSPYLWLDASDSATLWKDTAGTIPAAIGDTVALWSDKSTNGRSASQATVSKNPLRSSTGLTFDGVDDALNTGNVTFADTGVTVYAVASLTSAGSFPEIMAVGAAVQAVEIRGVSTSGKPSFVNGATNNGAGVTGITTPAGTATSMVGAGLQLLSATVSTSDVWTIWQSKVQADSRSAAITPTATPAPIYIGNRNNTLYWTGNIAELLVFNTEQSTATRQAVENYLSAKWGI